MRKKKIWEKKGSAQQRRCGRVLDPCCSASPQHPSTTGGIHHGCQGDRSGCPPAWAMLSPRHRHLTTVTGPTRSSSSRYVPTETRVSLPCHPSPCSCTPVCPRERGEMPLAVPPPAVFSDPAALVIRNAWDFSRVLVLGSVSPPPWLGDSKWILCPGCSGIGRECSLVCCRDLGGFLLEITKKLTPNLQI